MTLKVLKTQHFERKQKMTKKMFFTAILATFTLLLQYGCKTSEVAKEPALTEQPQAIAEVQTPAQPEQTAPAKVEETAPTKVEETARAKVEETAPAKVEETAPAKVEETAKEPTPAETKGYVLRVNCGYFGDAYTDKAGNVWQPDQDKSNDNKWGADYGQTIERPGLNIPDTNCPLIYESERYSMDDYKFDVPNGKYTVILHFAETYEGINGEGERVFSVSINGKTVLKDFDVYKDAGDFNKPDVKTYKDVEPVNGQIVIGFAYNVENPQINGIEIIQQ
jgi:hypothetical protein